MGRRTTTKITIALLTILALTTVLMVGCGNTKPETPSEKDESQAVIVEETETEEVTEVTEPTEVIEPETEEPTEVETEAVEPETEDDVIAIGKPIIEEEYIIILKYPSMFEGGVVGKLYEGDTVKIIGEVYNEDEQEDYYAIRCESVEEGYVLKGYIQIVE